jgi:SAM-dependent methyltransferase
MAEIRELGRRALQARVGHKWSQVSLEHRERDNWWHSAELKAYVEGRIAPGGVPGALAARLAGRRLERGVSIGCGSGGKELELVRAGLVGRFELFELSEVRCALGREAAAAAGLGERMTFHAADAFARPHAPYDLVYWDHALHHMLDVRRALEWSVAALAPGGLLVINDYVGPTRLQWTRPEVRMARAYMAAAAPHLAGARPVRFKIPLISRWRMTLRDPSEAPQSDRILAAARAFGGFLEPIGCAMINICGPVVVPVTDEGNPALALLIEWDRKAEAAGFAHFAFGIWQK